MANTTNFNWATPDDTDLVKDGAAAIRTLGSSIDTTLVDLKGGTTGQVLSKTTGTDMDFTWVDTDDANAIQNAIVDAKGDLIAASANDTPARLAVGANDLLLTAASGETTGLKWIGSWISFTPTLTNITLGNGTATGKYVKIGKVVFVFFELVFGSTTTISNYPGVTLPIAPVSYAGLLNGNVYMLDAATAEYYGVVYNDSGVRGTFFAQNAAGTYVRDAIIGATVPMTWTTNDKLQASFWYEVA